MSVKLTPCAGCSRHVKQDECTCPFCGAKVACADQASRAPGGRMSRAAMFAAGAVGVAVGTTDCSSAVSVPAYGGFFPPPHDTTDTGVGSNPSADGALDTGNLQNDGGSVPPIDDATAPDSGDVQTDVGLGPPVDGAAGDAATEGAPDAASAPDARDGGAMAVPAYGSFPPVDAAFRKD